MKKDILLEFETREEAEQVERELDFGKDTEAASYYEGMLPDSRRCMEQFLQFLVVRSIRDKIPEDVEGYNLDALISAFRNPEPANTEEEAVPHIKKSDIMKALIPAIPYYYLSGIQKGDAVSTIAPGLAKKIDNAKESRKFRKEDDTYQQVRQICGFFGVDVELIHQGIGKITGLKDEYLERFRKEYLDLRFPAGTPMANAELWNATQCYQDYEVQLKEQGKLGEGDTILTEHYLVIKQTGWYLALSKEMQGHVRELMRILYHKDQQLLGQESPGQEMRAFLDRVSQE